MVHNHIRSSELSHLSFLKQNMVDHYSSELLPTLSLHSTNLQDIQGRFHLDHFIPALALSLHPRISFLLAVGVTAQCLRSPIV